MEADEAHLQTALNLPLHQGSGKEECEKGFATQSQKLLNLDEENQEAYDDLIVSIEAKEGALNLLIAVCDDADFRERIITQYETELQPQFHSYRVTLARGEPTPQRRYSEAEALHLQALKLRKRLLGEKHPDVAISLSNLGYLYNSQERYSEAEPLYLQALEIFERGLGANHPKTLSVRKNLEELLRATHSSR